MNIDNIISGLKYVIDEYCPHLIAYYDDPLSTSEIASYFKQLGIENEALFEVYKWKNGISIEKQDYSIDLSLLQAGNFMALKDVLNLQAKNLDEKYWNISLVPFFVNYEGEYLLIETDNRSSDFGVVYFFSANFSFSTEPISYFDSVESMLKTIIRLFKEKAQWFDTSSERLDFDFDKREEICKEENPRSKRWD